MRKAIYEKMINDLIESGSVNAWDYVDVIKAYNKDKEITPADIRELETLIPVGKMSKIFVTTVEVGGKTVMLYTDRHNEKILSAVNM